MAGYVRRVEELEGEVMEQLRNAEIMECDHHELTQEIRNRLLDEVRLKNSIEEEL